MTDAGLKISIIYTSVPDFFLCISYHAWVYNQQSNYSVSVKDLTTYFYSMEIYFIQFIVQEKMEEKKFQENV